jgi:hypothetical protein
MPTIRNKVPNTCRTCGAHVPVGAGWSYPPSESKSGRWESSCGPCSGIAAPTAAKPRIAVTLAGGEVSFRATAKLGDELFRVFRAATTGARYAGAPSYANLAPFALAISILERLHATNAFALEIAPDVAARLQSHASGVVAAVADASERASVVDQALQARGLALFPFQRSGIGWLASRQGALLADDMGLGKTISAVTAAPAGSPMLIVAPAVAKGVWRRELSRWRPDLKVTVLEGRGSFRWPGAGEAVVVNYDILGDNPPTPPEGVTLVADEAHYLKGGAKVKRGGRFLLLSDLTRKAGGRVWLLTATPMLNRPMELWCVLTAAGLATEAFGSFRAFKQAFGAEEGRYGLEWPDYPAEPKVIEAALRRVSLRRMKRDVLPQLPTKIYKEVRVSLPKKLAKASAKLEAQLVAKHGTLKDALSNLTNMAEFEDMSALRAQLAEVKAEAALEVVEEYEDAGEPVVVFSAHRAAVDLIGSRAGWAIISGDTPNDKRTQIEDAFQRGELRGIAANILAGGVAITLTRASHAIFIDRLWTPALNAQAEDRICRIGQTRGCVIVDIIADCPLDYAVLYTLQRKQALIDASVDQSVRGADEVVTPDTLPDVSAVLSAGSAMAEAQAEAEAEAKVEAARREVAFAGDRERIAREVEAAEVARRNEERAARRLARNLERAARATEVRTVDISDAVTMWAVDGIQALAAANLDHCKVDNGIGFSVSTQGAGHYLADVIMTLGGWTPEELAAAIDICRFHRGQVGAPPEGGLTQGC